MEKTIVQFIIDNIFLFLPLGILGIISTIVLILTAKKEEKTESEDLESDFKTIVNIRFNLYFLVYLFIWIVIVIIGLLSNFIIPTIIGGVIATVPLLLLTFIEYQTKKSKVR